MYYLPTYCLVFFFLFSLFYPLPCSSSKQELGWCEAKFQCGNITAGFPFWGGNLPDHCGHPWLKLHCNKNRITSLFISKKEFSVFHLNQKSNTLTLARPELLSSFCSSVGLKTYLPPGLFELSPTYKILSVFYLCISSTHNLSSYKCPEIGPITASENPKDHETCLQSFDVNVPMSFVPEEKELNITNLESVLRKGFDVKVKIDMKAFQECSSSHGICSFNETWPYEFKCIQPHPPTASSKKEERWCEAKFQCGNITAGFPFSGGIRPQVCGHPSLELHCFYNKTSIIISDHLYNVLHIDQKSNTLRLARAELGGPFCNATFTSTTLPSEIFELSSTYKNLTVFYLCDPNLSYRSCYNCPGRGPVLVSQNLDYQYSCQDSFTINVPMSFVPEEKELNLAHLESALREGFEVKVKIDEKACQECLSSHGICSFKNTTQVCCKEFSSLGCNTLHPPDAQEHHILCSTPFSCGDQNDLSYPFWISGREDCGHPDFKLDCSGDFAEFNISSVKFRILEQNSTSRVIKLARSDYISDSCPQNPPSALFNENILPFAPGTKLLTIYYDCQDFANPPYVGELECDGVDGKSYYATSNLSSPFPRVINGLFCKSDISIPATGPLLNTLQNRPTPDNLHKALQEGFEVGLNIDCSMCIDSRGVCGYNKTLTSSGFVCYCIDEPHSHTCGSRNKGLSTKAKAGIAAGALGLVMLILGFCFLIRRRKKTKSPQYTSKELPITSYPSRETSNDPMIQEDVVGRRKKTSNYPRRRTSEDSRQQYLKALIPLKHYSYVQLEKITKSFSEVVGKGGFGTVYRGILCDGRSVAVKILKESQGNGEDFINEVASMSKTSHVNIVTLLGFCSEGSKKAIVYEFMENGSLDKFISSKRSSNMDWRELYRIALGVARGLEYLHHGCRTRIVHFDIKPQNVLLDDNLFPKVSDFGLAKLCEKKESIMSLLDTRGTIGYIAPELFSRMYGRVSHKSDVYSYGMLVLEMIGARNKPSTEDSALNPSSMYFPEWIYKDLENRDNGRLIENGINSEEEEIARKMTLVGLWCIQSSPSDRPTMDRVVEMMEGNLNALEVPPRPVFQIPAAPLQESSKLLAYTEVCSINVA